MTKLAFIMVASHSSSTLLAMLLGSHPQATTIGDTTSTSSMKNPGYRCSYGYKAQVCPFWLHVIAQMALRGFNLDVTDSGIRFPYPKKRFIDRVLRSESCYRIPFLKSGFVLNNFGTNQIFS